MSKPPDESQSLENTAPAADRDETRADRVQCPNCCRMAPVTSRNMGLLFYRCELCGTMGATSDPNEPA